jgi:hypothetical protein
VYDVPFRWKTCRDKTSDSTRAVPFTQNQIGLRCSSTVHLVLFDFEILRTFHRDISRSGAHICLIVSGAFLVLFFFSLVVFQRTPLPQILWLTPVYLNTESRISLYNHNTYRARYGRARLRPEYAGVHCTAPCPHNSDGFSFVLTIPKTFLTLMFFGRSYRPDRPSVFPAPARRLRTRKFFVRFSHGQKGFRALRTYIDSRTHESWFAFERLTRSSCQQRCRSVLVRLRRCTRRFLRAVLCKTTQMTACESL